MVSDYKYTWGKEKLKCKVIVKAPFKKGIKRNVLIELEEGRRVVVPWRALRRIKGMEEERQEYNNPVGAMCGICPDCSNVLFLSGGVPVCTFCGWIVYPEQ